MKPKAVKIEKKRADQINIGDWVVFMPVLGIALEITGIKTIRDSSTGLDRIGLDTANLADESLRTGWEPWRMFTVIEIEN